MHVAIIKKKNSSKKQEINCSHWNASGEENIGKIWNEKNMPYCTRITCDNLFIVNTKGSYEISYQSVHITFICKHFISNKNLYQSQSSSS